MMDPIKLAESSVALNLNLMKWRMFPNLNIDLLAQQKCLLVGSGNIF
jgi:ubiquitin-like modifier-activating enzyme ATG7